MQHPESPDSPPTRLDIAPGDIIGGKYRLDAIVGRGGMSVVYRATHLQLGQYVAIKILSPAALVMPEYVTRLRREARAVSRIHSHHVVRIHDSGEVPGVGVPYLVMEHLRGADLAAVLARRGPQPVALVAMWILQACEALAEAHARGIIHRDLKPANLFLTESVDGSPCIKVLDFGISRTRPRPGLTPLTDPGTVLGTPSYMAPEQMETAEAVEPRTDIWALGAILYELLVGRPPYVGDSLPQIFMRIMREKTPRPSAERPDVGAEIDAIVACCLAIDVERRYASVAELARALAAVGPKAAEEAAARVARILERCTSSEEEGGGLASGATTALSTGTGGALGALRNRVAAGASVALMLGGIAGFTALSAEQPAARDLLVPARSEPRSRSQSMGLWKEVRPRSGLPVDAGEAPARDEKIVGIPPRPIR